MQICHMGFVQDPPDLDHQKCLDSGGHSLSLLILQVSCPSIATAELILCMLYTVACRRGYLYRFAKQALQFMNLKL